MMTKHCCIMIMTNHTVKGLTSNSFNIAPSLCTKQVMADMEMINEPTLTLNYLHITTASPLDIGVCHQKGYGF